MERKLTTACAGYGAYELKTTYQRNMFLGTLFMILMVTLVIVSVHIYMVLNPPPMKIKIPPERDNKGGPFTVKKQDFKIKKEDRPGRPKFDRSKIKGTIPVPVHDTCIIDYDPTIATRSQLYNLSQYGNQPNGDGEEEEDYGDFGYGTGGGTPYYPSDTEFVKVEIMAKMIYEELPDFPRLAKLGGLEGSVWIKVLVDRDGKVRDAMVAKSSGSNAGFDEAALKAAYKCVYKPAIQNGNPVAVWVTYQVIFELNSTN